MQSGPNAIMQAANLYMFTMHNPVRWVDPLGLAALSAQQQSNIASVKRAYEWGLVTREQKLANIALNTPGATTTNPTRQGGGIVLSSNATPTQIREFNMAMAYLRTSPTARALINRIESSSVTVTIVFVDDHRMWFHHDFMHIYWDMRSGIVLGDGRSIQSAALGLAHELAHVSQYIEFGRRKFDIMTPLQREELILLEYENPIARELGEPVRAYYKDFSRHIRMRNSTNFGIVSLAARYGYINQNPWTLIPTIPSRSFR